MLRSFLRMRSEYCREHGLYPEQLDAWKAAFEAQDTDSEPASQADLAKQRKKRGNPWIASCLAMTGEEWDRDFFCVRKLGSDPNFFGRSGSQRAPWSFLGPQSLHKAVHRSLVHEFRCELQRVFPIPRQ